MAARKNTRKKLLPDEKVEVRSLEDGFLGSWHAATVVSCEEDLARVVRYDHLLSDEGSSNLTEPVEVSPVIDGLEVETSRYNRGTIRPLPPTSDLKPWCVHYGQCVDLFYEDAWWEGVVLDHEDGCEKRRIFFPDMGDEMEAQIDTLRLSIEWDEVSAEWRNRGNWLLLEVIEEVEREWPLPVSVKQIWYEVRVENGFEKLREWTCSGSRHIWKELVLRVIIVNYRIIIEHLFVELNSSSDSAELGQSLLEFSEKDFHTVLEAVGFFHINLAAEPSESTFPFDSEGNLGIDPNDNSHHHAEKQNIKGHISTVPTSEPSVPVSDPTLANFSPSPGEDSGIGSRIHYEASATNIKSSHKDRKISSGRYRLDWQPLSISGSKFCPDSVDEYNKVSRLKKKPTCKQKENVWKHLLHLGWKIDSAEENEIPRKRYFSPDRKYSYSLRAICAKLGKPDQLLVIPNYGSKTPVSVLKETRPPPLSQKSLTSRDMSIVYSSYESVVIESEYCPEAVRDYSIFGQQDRTGQKQKALKARNHLSATGWSFYFYPRGLNKREMRYISPNGKHFNSLIQACKCYMEANAITSGDLSPTVGRTRNVNVIKGFDGHSSTNKSHLPLIAMGPTGNRPSSIDTLDNMQNESSVVSMSKGLIKSVHKTRSSRKRRRKVDELHRVEGSPSPNRGKKSRASMKVRGDTDDSDYLPTARRSSKRVRDMLASSSQQTPRTLLSLLIDNNMVLPRAKVEFRCRKTGLVMREGRVAREGIKCSCCQKIYTLSKFEAHAGSTYHRPSANIFLEDGRSLLECQLQLKQHKSGKASRSVSRGMKGSRLDRKNGPPKKNRKNDYICSVCHFGGELVMCDQCPSSFHTYCVGLKEVPDGDWFCPPCRCKICGKSRFVEKNGQVNDSSVLSCSQCEHQYHAECLREKGIIKCHPEGKWFCQYTCEQIFNGLHKILGESVQVGTEDLTWTLLKSDSCDHDAFSDDELLVENYSKLSVALTVMHECFEPVKEPGTSRDLVEDVIFSRWSELNRLNFQGFYTVLLEKNDELISAATVRIYGNVVAEVPLIATRFQYRRLGMCRILMNELEKKLSELGVERLVLPAVPSVLNTWTTSFGFSVMSNAERLKFLDYTFLEFQGTVICQKVLTSNPSSVSSLSTGTHAESCDHLNENVNIELDGNSTDCTVSEFFRGEQVEEAEFVECIVTVAEKETGNSSAQSAIVVYEPTVPNFLSFLEKIELERRVGFITDDKKPEDNSPGVLKCYKRRRISAC